MRQAGESDAAFQARLKAEQDATQAYRDASPRDRAVIDQTQLWDGYSSVFLARVEKVKVGRRIYSIGPQTMSAASKPKRHGRMLPPKPIEPIPFLSPALDHSVYVRPLHRLKGPKDFKPAWQPVGGTICGASADGDLSFAMPGDLLIIFIRHDAIMHPTNGVWVESSELSLYGLRREDVVAPQILTAFGTKTGLAN